MSKVTPVLRALALGVKVSTATVINGRRDIGQNCEWRTRSKVFSVFNLSFLTSIELKISTRRLTMRPVAKESSTSFSKLNEVQCWFHMHIDESQSNGSALCHLIGRYITDTTMVQAQTLVVLRISDVVLKPELVSFI